MTANPNASERDAREPIAGGWHVMNARAIGNDDDLEGIQVTLEVHTDGDQREVMQRLCDALNAAPAQQPVPAAQEEPNMPQISEQDMAMQAARERESALKHRAAATPPAGDVHIAQTCVCPQPCFVHGTEVKATLTTTAAPLDDELVARLRDEAYEWEKHGWKNGPTRNLLAAAARIEADAREIANLKREIDRGLTPMLAASRQREQEKDAEIGKLREALREQAISPIKERHSTPTGWWKTVGYRCLRCNEDWAEGEPERHAADCLARKPE